MAFASEADSQGKTYILRQILLNITEESCHSHCYVRAIACNRDPKRLRFEHLKEHLQKLNRNIANIFLKPTNENGFLKR